MTGRDAQEQEKEYDLDDYDDDDNDDGVVMDDACGRFALPDVRLKVCDSSLRGRGRGGGGVGQPG